MSRIQRTSAGYTLENVDRLVPTSAVSSGSIQSTIPNKRGEMVPSIRDALFNEYLSFASAILWSSIRLADRSRKPTGISFKVTHVASDPYRTSAADSTRNPSRFSQSLLPLGHSSQTSAFSIVNMQGKPYLCCTCLSHPWITSISGSRIQICSRIHSSRLPSSPRISGQFPFAYTNFKTHSTELNLIISVAGKTSVL
jgi:hypothetical protein